MCIKSFRCCKMPSKFTRAFENSHRPRKAGAVRPAAALDPARVRICSNSSHNRTYSIVVGVGRWLRWVRDSESLASLNASPTIVAHSRRTGSRNGRKDTAHGYTVDWPDPLPCAASSSDARRSTLTPRMVQSLHAPTYAGACLCLLIFGILFKKTNQLDCIS